MGSCDECLHENCSIYEYPCNQCINNYTNKYEPKCEYCKDLEKVDNAFGYCPMCGRKLK